jgi:hypothetical protein
VGQAPGEVLAQSRVDARRQAVGPVEGLRQGTLGAGALVGVEGARRLVKVSVQGVGGGGGDQPIAIPAGDQEGAGEAQGGRG